MRRSDVIEHVKRIVQTSQVGDGGGVDLLLSDPEDFSLAIDQAIARFGLDRPNTSVIDLVIATAGWSLVLAGGGSPLVSGWIDGVTYVSAVWSPFTATQGLEPNDPNEYRVLQGPGGTTILELLDHTAQVGSTVRLGITTPYVVADLDANTTIPAGLARAFEVLSAYFVLMMAAARTVRNTGSSGIPGDIVDRRTQSDQYRSVAKDFLTTYKVLMGIGGDSGAGAGSSVAAASGFKDLDIRTSNPAGSLWHGTGTR